MGCPSGTGPSTVVNVVQGKLGEITNYADAAFNAAQTLATQLNSFTIEPIETTVTFNVPAQLGSVFNKPGVPNEPSLTFGEVEDPGSLTVPGVEIPEFGTAPVYSVAKPSLNLPQVPDELSVTPPGDAPTVSDTTVPDAPTLTLPTVPTLEELDLPDAPTTSLPSFTATAPTNDLTAPGEIFSYSEDAYSSTQLTEVQARVSAMLAGGTGIPDSVWNAIWDRGRGNQAKASQAAIEAAFEEWASRGFSLPTGVLNANVEAARQAAQDAEQELNRELVIQQATQEVENLRFAVQQGIALEAMLGQLYSQRMGRALDAAKYVMEAAIKVFDAKVALYNASVEAYATEAEVYKARIEGERLAIDIYRGELEGQRILGELNRQEVEIYNARLLGLQTQADLYRIEVQGAQARVEVDKARIDAFRGTVEAYGEQVRARESELRAYSEQVKGELAKVDIYRTEVDAFAKRVEAYRTSNEALSISPKLNLEVNDQRIREFSAELERYKAGIQAEAERVRAGVGIYDGQSRIYAAELGAEQSRVVADSRQFELALQEAATTANLQLKEAEINIEQAQRLTALELEVKKVVAQVQSQLASAALAAMNIGATLQGQSSEESGCTTRYTYTGDA